jgi:hypothetical protein
LLIVHAFCSVTFMVISNLFWLLVLIPFVPATPVQLWLAIWILIPQNEGEKVVYLAMSSQLLKFEEKMTYWRHIFFEAILNLVLQLARVTCAYCLPKISSETLVEMRKLTHEIDQNFSSQMKLRGV